MFSAYFVFLMIFCVNSCLSHGGDHVVKGGRTGHQHGIKSYGGYFHDQGQGGDNFVHSSSYHQQYSQPNNYNYQPYGWNFNQPIRTYGGVMPQNYPYNQQGFGWFGSGNQYGNQASNNNGPAPFPKVPSMFLPNFVPPVYFPNNYPYPNFNPHPYAPPFNNDNGQQSSGQNPPINSNNPEGQYGHNQNIADGHHNQNPTSVQPLPGQTGHSYGGQNVINRQGSDGDKFLTNAFFDPRKMGSNTINRHWTQEDEMRWQATTKAPYFENKVPGLECTLPASAVLGATTALKASSLLPLQVPVGKPILSCNATGLLQAQISLDGVIYDCDRSAITTSCPRVDEFNVVVDDCLGETLECDVRVALGSGSVSCTNGTLISNHPIVCKSATLMEKKNVLNCSYKKSFEENSPTPRPPLTTQRPSLSVVRIDLTTSRPIITPQTSLSPPPIPVRSGDYATDGLDDRASQDRNRPPLESLGLTNEVKQAMRSVFPHELLSVTSLKMYLPPKSSSGQLPQELKHSLEGVFPHELFAVSHTEDSNINEVRSSDNQAQGLSLQQEENTDRSRQTEIPQNLQSQWGLNLNRNTKNNGPSFKTSPNRVSQRFMADNDDEDRLIFSP